MELKLFDSLSHPTLDGKWLNSDHKSSFKDLSEDMKKNSIYKACAIGMYNINSFEPKKYINECKKYPELIPICGWDPTVNNQVDYLKEIHKLGYKGIKIHPRFSKVDLESEKILVALKTCADLNLVVFLCTYMHCNVSDHNAKDPYLSTIKILQKCPKTQIILVHGGDVSLMKYAELARFNENVLLDLSLTICKYEGSSLDLDIKYLFKNFDRRICIGSDYPEYNYPKLLERIYYFSKGLNQNKIDNITYKNLQNFLTSNTIGV